MLSFSFFCLRSGRFSCRGSFYAAGLRVLQIFVEELEECALPQNCILRFQNPVVLVGEYQHFSFQTTHLGGIEGHHALRS